MSETADEAREYARKTLSQDASDGTLMICEQSYIAGYQSAERKSEAKDARIAELEYDVGRLRDLVTNVRLVKLLGRGNEQGDITLTISRETRLECPTADIGEWLLSGDYRKTREMVRELVGALEECLGPLDLDLTCAHCGLRDAHTTDCPDTLAEGVLRKFKDEIDQLGREQNGASSTKLMGGME